jgi:hypothetical protein
VFTSQFSVKPKALQKGSIFLDRRLKESRTRQERKREETRKSGERIERERERENERGQE